MSALFERLKSRDYRYEIIIKLILLFLFLMFTGRFIASLPPTLAHIVPQLFRNTTISFMVILLLANWLIDRQIILKVKTGLTHKFFLVSFLYWFLHVIGYFYSSNTKEAGFIIEKKLSLILFPLIFATINLNETSKLNIYKWFVFLLLFFSSTCMLYGMYHYKMTGDIKMLSLEYSLYIDIHRVVMSMYLTLGAYFAFELHKQGRIKLAVLILYLAISGAHILLMASRLYMVVYLIFVCFLLYRYISSKKLLYGVMAFGLTLSFALGFVMYQTNKVFKSQIETLFMGKKTSAANTNGVSERKYQWDAAMALIIKHPIAGVGQGDVVDSLQQEYKDMYWDIGYTHRYHAHNQYLQTFIGLGLLGFISLVFMIFYPFVFYKQTGVEAKICSILFGISLLTDNHTELQQSIVFMFLWLGMFINLKSSKRLQENTA
ncbi:MAG TPA: O-antigen ligase family protein [Cytophagales bacterium]|nr:O-antigen ligase family protein [Cytophagales bacterium]